MTVIEVNFGQSEEFAGLWNKGGMKATIEDHEDPIESYLKLAGIYTEARRRANEMYQPKSHQNSQRQRSPVLLVPDSKVILDFQNAHKSENETKKQILLGIYDNKILYNAIKE